MKLKAQTKALLERLFETRYVCAVMEEKTQTGGLVPQDLHTHTTFSKYDSAVVEQQTVELVAQFRHARVQGISDHLENIETEDEFECYFQTVKAYNLYPGLEVNGADWVTEALRRPVDYYIYHCKDKAADYAGADKLLSSNKPVIIAHPCAFETDLSLVPSGCYIELNNRYIWRKNWRSYYGPWASQKKWVIGSDAHQPNWLNHRIARGVAEALEIKESVLFEDNLDTIAYEDIDLCSPALHT